MGTVEIETAKVVAHEAVSGPYKRLALAAPGIADAALPGQFVHLLVPRLDGAVLRRPFSIFEADRGMLGILYKPVGRGTEAMVALGRGDEVSLLGPLGNGFPCDHEDTIPVLVAGGYGVAPLCFLARRLPGTGSVFLGAATASDILCSSEFTDLGWDVHTATEDGSQGHHGLVTDPLRAWLGSLPGEPRTEFYACGPEGLLRAVGDLAQAAEAKAWLSLDKHMGCGVGACLACVQRIRDNGGTDHWARVCRDGPVFEARQIIWD